MNFKRLLHQPLGKVFISILLGIGLASLFRKVCNDKNCILFKGPVTADIEGKVFKHGSKCYRYNVQSNETCLDGKRTVDMASKTMKEMEEAKPK